MPSRISFLLSNSNLKEAQSSVRTPLVLCLYCASKWTTSKPVSSAIAFIPVAKIRRHRCSSTSYTHYPSPTHLLSFSLLRQRNRRRDVCGVARARIAHEGAWAESAIGATEFSERSRSRARVSHCSSQPMCYPFADSARRLSLCSASESNHLITDVLLAEWRLTDRQLSVSAKKLS